MASLGFFGYIYALQSPSGKIYIGQTIKDVQKRFDKHIADAKRGSPYPIHRAIRKYGEEVRIVWAFPVSGCQQDLDDAEKQAIAIYKTRAPNGYNASEGGAGGSAHKGKKHSDQTKSRISTNNARKGKPGTWTGKHRSEETKAKISAARRGVPRSEETKAKISAARKGYPTSSKTRAKISAALKGRKLSEEHKARQSEVKKGKPWSKARRIAQNKKQRREK